MLKELTINVKENLSFFIESIVNSYTQIFFSHNKTLGVAVMLVTFINPFLGVCGLCAVILINISAKLFGFSSALIHEGMYGFNALLLGLAMGYEYKFNTEFAIVFVAAVLILLMITVWAGTILGKHQLPYLSLPFLLTYWLVYLACGNFDFIQLQEQRIYTENYIANQSLSPVYVFAHSLDDCQLPLLVKSYFKTLSSTFFQNSVLAGIGIASALLYFSRIAFSLSMRSPIRLSPLRCQAILWEYTGRLGKCLGTCSTQTAFPVSEVMNASTFNPSLSRFGQLPKSRGGRFSGV